MPLLVRTYLTVAIIFSPVVLHHSCIIKKMEATPGFEPGMKDLQSSALPLGYVAI